MLVLYIQIPSHGLTRIAMRILSAPKATMLVLYIQISSHGLARTAMRILLALKATLSVLYIQIPSHRLTRTATRILLAVKIARNGRGDDSNGVPRANENWLSKLPRSSSSHPFTENGRILEPCQISIPIASDRPEVAVSSAKIENKECKINGFIEA